MSTCNSQVGVEHRLPDRFPTVKTLGGRPTACAEIVLQLRVIEDAKDGVCKFSGVITDQDVIAINSGETFASD